jgi:hypothetical protein
MKTEKKGKVIKISSSPLIFIVSIFLFFSFPDLCRGGDWTPPPWGLNLEEFNRIIQENNKTGLIKEDKDRSEIEFQYAPTKSFKIRRGKLVALLILTDPSKPGRLFGYAFEGKIFGRAVFFKDHPEIFPETAARNLNEQYPQGKVFRSFGTTRTIPFFEYQSEQLYIFSTERGIFYYDPQILEKVIRIEQGQFTLEEKKFEKENKDKSGKF